MGDLRGLAVLKDLRASRTVLAFALAMSLAPGAGAWSQPANAYPPGPDYAGVAGSAAENARITALCGGNRNAKDGYFAPPAQADQTVRRR